MPEFSVIIPSGGQRKDIALVLDALQEQSDNIHEILVVWDGESWPEMEVRFPESRYAVLPEKNGPSAVRNLGAVQAKGDWLIFLDDDVVPEPGAFETIIEYIQLRPEVTSWAFKIIPDPRVKKNIYVTWAYQDMAHSRFDDRVVQIKPAHFCSSFVAIRRDVFERVGGFDEQFKRPGYEDVEWAWRAVQNGELLYACPVVKGLHLREMDRKWFLNRCQRFAPAIQKLYEKHSAAVSSQARFMLSHRLLAGFVGLFWFPARTFLPVIEKTPSALACKVLSLISILGMSQSISGLRRDR